jgi:Flp pilus assembly protein TadG
MLKAFHRDETGAALTEFLIALPLLLLLLVGSFQLGYYVMYNHSVEKAVRNGARYLARVPQQGIGGWGAQNMRNLMVTGTVDGTGAPLLQGWTTTNAAATIAVATSPDPVPALPTRLAWVRVTATVPVDLPVLSAFGFEDGITVTASHEERHVGE